MSNTLSILLVDILSLGLVYVLFRFVVYKMIARAMFFSLLPDSTKEDFERAWKRDPPKGFWGT
jgi:hypothetical protein